MINAGPVNTFEHLLFSSPIQKTYSVLLLSKTQIYRRIQIWIQILKKIRFVVETETLWSKDLNPETESESNPKSTQNQYEHKIKLYIFLFFRVTF